MSSILQTLYANYRLKNLTKKRQTAGSHKIAGNHQKNKPSRILQSPTRFYPESGTGFKIKKAPKPNALKLIF